MADPRAHDPDALLGRLALDELGSLSVAEHSLQSVLQRVTDLAARVLPGDAVTSVTIVSDRGPSTVAASGDLALELDREQYRSGSGPCLEAATTGRPVEVPDTRVDPRWGGFPRLAAARGCRSMLSVPLPAPEQVRGGINVYAGTTGPLDPRARELAARLVSYAVVPVSNMYLYEGAVERAGNLLAALDTRAVIDQAKGILMERHRLTADGAFQALARASMETNTKLRDVADRLVRTGEFPPS